VTLALDTNVIIDLIRKRRPRIRDRYDDAVLAEKPLVTSLIVFHELQFGVASSVKPQRQQDLMFEALEGVAIEPLDEKDVGVAALVRYELRRAGTPIGPYDLLIAGQALSRGWTLVTSNSKEFERVPGLKLEDWSA